MAIKPSPTIAGKRRKLFNNNKQTIEPAIGDSIPGGSGGGNVLTLYVGNVTASSSARAFKDRDHTERYKSFDEAANAVNGASSIKVIVTVSPPTAYFANSYTITPLFPGLPKSVAADIVMGDGVATVELFSDEIG